MKLRGPNLLGRAVQRCAVPAPGRRIRVCAEVQEKPGRQIRHGGDVCAMLRSAADADRESFYAIHLDSQHRVIGVEEVAKGTLTSVETSPREVFKAAILSNAAAIIIAHNHPSGDPTPSPADHTLTRRMVDVGNMLGIRVLDHVIVAREGCTSLAETGTKFSGAGRRRR